MYRVKLKAVASVSKCLYLSSAHAYVAKAPTLTRTHLRHTNAVPHIFIPLDLAIALNDRVYVLKTRHNKISFMYPS